MLRKEILVSLSVKMPMPINQYEFAGYLHTDSARSASYISLKIIPLYRQIFPKDTISY